MISLGLIGALLVIAGWSYMDRPEQTKPVVHKIGKVTAKSTVNKVESLLGPRISGDRPRTIVWAIPNSDIVLSETFIFQSQKVPLKFQDRARGALAKAGYVRMEEHCKGINNKAKRTGYFTAGYCTYTPIAIHTVKD